MHRFSSSFFVFSIALLGVVVEGRSPLSARASGPVAMSRLGANPAVTSEDQAVSSPDANPIQITGVTPVAGAAIDTDVDLWAKVKNTTDIRIPSGCAVWFKVDGMLGPWVGATSIGGLAPGAEQWYKFTWHVSIEIQPGSYNYGAQAYMKISGGFRVISDLSANAGLVVTGTTSGLLAHINKVLEVSDAPIGGQATLQAEIQNIGKSTFSAPTKVFFYVNGLSNPWVGSTPIGGLFPATTASYAFPWDIPGSVQPGTYTYQARAYWNATPISDWSPAQKFAVHSPGAVAAQILDVDRVTDAAVGGKVALGAEVKNIGTQTMPGDAQVWFWVDGGGLTDHWAGSTSIASLAPGTLNWFSLSWTIPKSAQGGAYSYKAQAWAGGKTISGFGVNSTFTVSGDPKSGFDEQFTVGSAPNWIQDYGTWGVNNGYFTAPGMAKSVVTSTFNTNYADFDFSASLYRSGLESDLPTFLEVRASGSATGQNRTLMNGYRFEYNPRGQVRIVKFVAGYPIVFLDWVLNAAVKQGQAFNTLRVKAVGTLLWYYVNEVQIWSGIDESFASGRVGFGFYSDTGATGEALFVDWAKLTASP